MSNVQAIGHVIRILDEYTLLIDVGRSQLSVDDEIEIYELGDPIRDINGNFLSEYIHVKDRLTVIETQDKYSICQKTKYVIQNSLSTLSAWSPMLEKGYTKKVALDVDPKDFQPFPQYSLRIHIGDLVKKAWHSNFIMVRWSPTEMVVVETTSENPSYRYAEGGIFSFYGYICLW